MPRVEVRADDVDDYDWVAAGAGRIVLVGCPGGRFFARRSVQASGALAVDIEALHGWGVTALVSLVEWPELALARARELPNLVRRANLRWYHLPIRDMQPPGPVFEEAWSTTGRELRQGLRRGERIALHCWAGLGRTGTVAARLLVELGTPPQTAIRQVRAARPGAIQTEAQERHVLGCREVNSGLDM